MPNPSCMVTKIAAYLFVGDYIKFQEFWDNAKWKQADYKTDAVSYLEI